MQFTDLQRKEASEKARLINAEASASQDATKLIRGFSEFDPSTTGRRGVWELVQNACDLTEQCEVTVDFQNGDLSFSHNGIPFTTETLTYLIKQVTTKSQQSQGPETGKKPVGRYGTGFITTHAYGRKLRLSGSLKIIGLGVEEAYLELHGFLIDRSEREVIPLTKALAAQLLQVEDMPLQATVYEPTASDKTTFHYHPETTAEQTYVGQAWQSLLVNTPYVMAFNKSLVQVCLVDENGTMRTFRKGEARKVDEFWQLPIECDGKETVSTCLYEPYGPLQVIAPVNEDGTVRKLGMEVPRQFLYFPLIGTENWGCDFVVHSDLFEARNERDGVHVSLENDQNVKSAINNRELLKNASEAIFSYLEKRLPYLKEPLQLAHVNFTAAGRDDEGSFRREMQELWSEQLARLELVDTDAGDTTLPGRLAPSACHFLSLELLAEDAQVQAAIQQIAVKLWPGKLPKMELACSWEQILAGWGWQDTKWINAEKLAEAIGTVAELQSFDFEALLNLYEHLKAQGHGELFKHFALLPNRNGKLVKSGTEFQQAQDLTGPFMQVLESIVPKMLDKLLDERFVGLETLPPFNRRHLGQQVNDEVGRLLASPEGKLPVKARDGLLILCSVFSSTAPAVLGSLRWRLMPMLYRFYRLDYQPVIIPNVIEAEEIRYEEQPLRNVVRQFFQDFEANYNIAQPAEKSELRDLLLDCLDLLSQYTDMRKELQGTVSIIPNQKNELCVAGELVIEKEFGPDGSVEQAEQLKNWAHRITDVDYRHKLVHPDFVDVADRLERPEQDGMMLANNLELAMGNMQALEKINSHPKQKEILEIIQQLNHGWDRYFIRINNQKATITLNRVTDDSLKESLFGILSLPDNRIEDLGELVKATNLVDLLAEAQAILARKAKQAETFAFKKMLGEQIEKLVLNRIDNKLDGLDVVILDEQNGQDLVVRLNGEVVYQIEVKSLWDSQSSTTLSYRQLSEAVESPERYALCSVDLTNYYPTDGSDRHHIKDIERIISHIRFVTDIGKHIKPLVADLKQVENNDDAVRLADQYRVIVPRRITKAGKLFGEFVDFLVVLLEADATASSASERHDNA